MRVAGLLEPLTGGRERDRDRETGEEQALGVRPGSQPTTAS